MNFEFLTGWLYLTLWRVIRWLPEGFAYKLFYRGADILTRRNGKSVARLKSNLARTQNNLTPLELDLLTYKAMRSYMRYWCDTFRFPDWSKERLIGTVKVENEHLLLDPIAAKTGVIVALPHAGNWDHAGAYFCSKGIPLVAVVERLKPDALFKKFLAYRSAMGIEVLPHDGRVIATLAKRLREGAIIALVADRDLSKGAIDVDFFNGKARMPAGPAVLALNTGAPLITAFVSYTSDGIHILFRPVRIPKKGTNQENIKLIVQECADHFADGIRNHPEDWHMLQRIWVDGDFEERN